jgi:hypothetical protein
MLARVMENFINKPHQLVEELGLSKEQKEETTPELLKRKHAKSNRSSTPQRLNYAQLSMNVFARPSTNSSS